MIVEYNKVREVMSTYQSDNSDREAMIFVRSREIDIKTKPNRKRAVLIQEQYRCFSIQFYEKGKKVGYIVYHNKDLSYVERAAENWVKYIMDLKTVKKHSTIF
jgi:hypothetical protein